MSEQKPSNGSKGGRPSDFGEWTAGEVEDYLESFISAEIDSDGKVGGAGLNGRELIPTRAGLALHLSTSKASLCVWAKYTAEDRPNDNVSQFLESLFKLDQLQEIGLVSGGLSGVYNPAISKLMLSNHGYAEKVDNISSDGSMTPKPFNDFYAKQSES